MKKVFVHVITKVLIHSTFAYKLITIFMNSKQNMEMNISSQTLSGYL